MYFRKCNQERPARPRGQSSATPPPETNVGASHDSPLPRLPDFRLPVTVNSPGPYSPWIFRIAFMAARAIGLMPSPPSTATVFSGVISMIACSPSKAEATFFR